MAILAAAGTAAGAVKSVTGFIGGLFGNDRDKARFQEADQLANAALNGNANALLKLKCLSGDNSVLAEACATGAHPDACGATQCGYATAEARGYAAALVLKVEGQLAAGQAGGVVVDKVVQPALSAAGYSIVPTPDWSTLLLLGALGFGGYLLLKGR